MTASVAPRVDRLSRNSSRGLGAWTPRQQVDDAAHRARAVQRRRHAFDHLDLPEIHRRDLQQPEPADLAEQRQPVREEARVAAAHALNAHARGAERRRRRLHAHAAHFVQHHDDVAGRHEHLLFDFFALEHLDAHRLILETLVGACRCHDGDAFPRAIGCGCSSTTTSCVAPAATCTDAVAGANPGFTTVMSTVPAAVTMVVVPDASVRWLAPATTTSASSTGFSAART